jgi:hypothetical protein
MLRWVVGIDRLGGGSPPQEGCRPPSGRPQSVQSAPELSDGQRVAMGAGLQIFGGMALVVHPSGSRVGPSTSIYGEPLIIVGPGRPSPGVRGRDGEARACGHEHDLPYPLARADASGGAFVVPHDRTERCERGEQCLIQAGTIWRGCGEPTPKRRASECAPPSTRWWQPARPLAIAALARKAGVSRRFVYDDPELRVGSSPPGR